MKAATDNEQRAERGWEALFLYAHRYDLDTRDDDDHRAAAVDLMTDLLHAIDRYTGWDTEEVRRMSWHHFMAEKSDAPA